MESEQSIKRSFPLGDALVIGGITLLAYALSHVYELGYAKATGIPNYLLEVSLSKQLFACFAVLLPALGLLSIFYSWYRRGVNADESSWRRLLLRFWPMAAIATAACFIYRFKWSEIAPYLIFAVAIAILTQVLALFYAAKRFRNSKKLQPKVVIEDSSPTMFDPLIKCFGIGAFWLSIAIIILFMVAFMTGRAESLFKEDYLVLYDKKPYVVLRVYGDKAILRGIDKENRLFTDEIQILKIGEKNSVLFKKETIGPLSLKKRNANKANAADAKSSAAD